VGATVGVLHPVALPTINVTQTGYLYVYLSYDNAGGAAVYFDEFTITYREGPAVQILWVKSISRLADREVCK
jgi:hypothetical protein